MDDLTKRVKETLKKYGDEAAAHFGVNPTTLKRYMRKGHYPLQFVSKVLADASDHNAMEPISSTLPEFVWPDPGVPQTQIAAPVGSGQTPSVVTSTTLEKRVDNLYSYLQQTVDFYLKQHQDRLTRLEASFRQLQVQHLRHVGMPSLTNPGANAPVEGVFTTNPNGVPTSHPLQSGIAPTAAQVAAQAGMMTIEGVPVPGAQVAGPATYPAAGGPAFGLGWLQPRPRG